MGKKYSDSIKNPYVKVQYVWLDDEYLGSAYDKPFDLLVPQYNAARFTAILRKCAAYYGEKINIKSFDKSPNEGCDRLIKLTITKRKR